VTSTDGNTKYQEVSINTSGDVDLYLKDKFGSLQLQSCDDNDCNKAVTYAYNFKNIGDTPMTITRADRVRDGETLDFLSSVDPKELGVGDSTFVTEKEQIDVCVDSKSTTTMNAEADPPAGTPCFDSFTYNLITKAECKVKAEIFCSSGESIDCGDLLRPTNTEDCIVDVFYSFKVSNIGTNNMTITMADIIANNNEPVSILPPVDKRELAPGVSITGTQSSTIDVCATEKQVTTLEVDANGETGRWCYDEDVYEYVTKPPAPTTPPPTPPPFASPTPPPPFASPTPPPPKCPDGSDLIFPNRDFCNPGCDGGEFCCYTNENSFQDVQCIEEGQVDSACTCPMMPAPTPPPVRGPTPPPPPPPTPPPFPSPSPPPVPGPTPPPVSRCDLNVSSPNCAFNTALDKTLTHFISLGFCYVRSRRRNRVQHISTTSRQVPGRKCLCVHV
jgi:hypothetical protein